MRRFITLMIALSVVVAACSSDATSGEDAGGGSPATTTAPTTTAAPEPEVAVFIVTYDGTDCSFDDPGALTEGPLEVTFVNNSDTEVGLHMAVLNDGAIYDEYKALMDSNEDLNGNSETYLWLNGIFEGQEPRGELSETVFVDAGAHAVTCVGWVNSDGPPDLHIHLGTIEVTASA